MEMDMNSDVDDQLTAQWQAAEETWMDDFLNGPRTTRWETMPPQVGDMAPDAELPDSEGGARRLSEWWEKGPVHLVFMRHYGCGCLANRWEELKDATARISNAGATTVAVGQAGPERSREVAERRGYRFPVLCDPNLDSYRAYGLLEGVVPSVFHDTPWEPGDTAQAEKMTAARRGTDRALVDHAWQLPGEFVIARGGRIALAYRAQTCEDFPPTTVLLGAIAAAQA
jgi:peroxiredoxin